MLDADEVGLAALYVVASLAAVDRRHATALPLGILAVNVLGAFAVGVVANLAVSLVLGLVAVWLGRELGSLL